VNRVSGFVERGVGWQQEEIVAGNAEETEANDKHAGDSTATEGNIQCRVDAFGCRLSGAGIRAHGHKHTDVAGKGRQNGADGETDGCCPARER
jgi:hypothetical protein